MQNLFDFCLCYCLLCRRGKKHFKIHFRLIRHHIFSVEIWENAVCKGKNGRTKRRGKKLLSLLKHLDVNKASVSGNIGNIVLRVFPALTNLLSFECLQTMIRQNQRISATKLNEGKPTSAQPTTHDQYRSFSQKRSI